MRFFFSGVHFIFGLFVTYLPLGGRGEGEGRGGLVVEVRKTELWGV